MFMLTNREKETYVEYLKKQQQHNIVSMPFVWKLLDASCVFRCCFFWNLLLLQFEFNQKIRIQLQRMHYSLKTQSNIYAGNIRCWWHAPFFFFIECIFFLRMFVLFISGFGHVCRLFVLKSVNFFLSFHSRAHSFFLKYAFVCSFVSILTWAKNVSSKRENKKKTILGILINLYVYIQKRTFYLAATRIAHNYKGSF